MQCCRHALTTEWVLFWQKPFDFDRKPFDFSSRSIHASIHATIHASIHAWEAWIGKKVCSIPSQNHDRFWNLRKSATDGISHSITLPWAPKKIWTISFERFFQTIDLKLGVREKKSRNPAKIPEYPDHTPYTATPKCSFKKKRARTNSP